MSKLREQFTCQKIHFFSGLGGVLGDCIKNTYSIPGNF